MMMMTRKKKRRKKKKYNDMQKEYNELNNLVKVREKQKNQYETEIKMLKRDVDTYKGENEHLKTNTEASREKEKSILQDVKSKDNMIDAMKKDVKSLEKEIESGLKKMKRLNDDVDNREATITTLHTELDKKHKQYIETEAALINAKAQHIDFMTNVHKANQFEIDKLKAENEKVQSDYDILKKEYNEVISSKSKEVEDTVTKLNVSKTDVDKYKHIIDELSGNLNHLTIENANLKKKTEELNTLLSEKDKKITDFTEVTKLYLTDNNFLSSTKNISHNFIPEIQMNTLAITSNVLKYDNDEFVSVKRLEKGTKAVFVPHSAGIYVSINLNSVANYSTNVDSNSQGNYDSNMDNKFFKCNAILSLEMFEPELKELLMEHSLIIIGRIGKITDHYANGDNNPYSLPEENNYLLCELDKIDYILGFQGEEMIFRNYIF